MSQAPPNDTSMTPIHTVTNSLISQDSTQLSLQHAHHGEASTNTSETSLDQEMEINVRTLTNKVITLIVKLNDTVLSVKKQIESLEGIPVDRQWLVYRGKLIGSFGYLFDDDQKTLHHYDIRERIILHLALKPLDISNNVS